MPGDLKNIIFWTLAAAILMIGCPWLAVTFAGSAGMAVCFLLFYGINPMFCAVCGAYAGKNIRQLWMLPILAAVLFLCGAWLFFDMGEPAFLMYSGFYLLIGTIAMLIRFFLGKR